MWWAVLKFLVLTCVCHSSEWPEKSLVLIFQLQAVGSFVTFAEKLLKIKHTFDIFDM